jgi:upstream activation factor subunit UAF30
MQSGNQEDINEVGGIVNPLLDEFEKIENSLSMFKGLIVILQKNIKQLEKNVRKEMKILKKEANKNKNKGNRKPSGFATPSKVTKELCDFMNKTEGTEIARTQVTRALISYIKENQLENKQNSKFISPDEKLKNLLCLKDDDELTYFNIQKYMNKHFITKGEISSTNNII